MPFNFTVVRAEDAVGDSVLASFVGCHAFVLVANFGTVEEIDSVINKFYHNEIGRAHV